LVWDLISQAGAWRPEDNPRDWIAPLYATLPSYLEQAIDEGRRRADDLIKT
jgi:hypothetical protein